jgi:hypothetical protein
MAKKTGSRKNVLPPSAAKIGETRKDVPPLVQKDITQTEDENQNVMSGAFLVSAFALSLSDLLKARMKKKQ